MLNFHTEFLSLMRRISIPYMISQIPIQAEGTMEAYTHNAVQGKYFKKLSSVYVFMHV